MRKETVLMFNGKCKSLGVTQVGNIDLYFARECLL